MKYIRTRIYIFLRETEKRDKKQAKAEAEERLKIMVRLARNLSFERKTTRIERA